MKKLKVISTMISIVALCITIIWISGIISRAITEWQSGEAMLVLNRELITDETVISGGISGKDVLRCSDDAKYYIRCTFGISDDIFDNLTWPKLYLRRLL